MSELPFFSTYPSLPSICRPLDSLRRAVIAIFAMVHRIVPNAPRARGAPRCRRIQWRAPANIALICIDRRSRPRKDANVVAYSRFHRLDFARLVGDRCSEPAGAGAGPDQGADRQAAGRHLPVRAGRCRDRDRHLQEARPRRGIDRFRRRPAGAAGHHRRCGRYRDRLGTGAGPHPQGRAGDRHRRHGGCALCDRAGRAQGRPQERERAQGQDREHLERGLAHRLARAEPVAPAGLGHRRHQARRRSAPRRRRPPRSRPTRSTA